MAFDWNNLNLSCDQCNNKRPNKDIPVDKVLDPCKDSDEEIQRCITFDNEIMYENNDSEKGRLTIQKFNLNSQLQQLTTKITLSNKDLIQIQRRNQKLYR